MDNNTTLIMVGGMSGVGKTALIEGVINAYNSPYRRPVSYTTRKRRVNEGSSEYIFTSHEEMEALYEESYFLNYDEVYGERYAISKDSVVELNSQGFIPIKEIHPTNHIKIKEVLPFAISVLIKADEDILALERENRMGEDECFYTKLDESEFDIVYYNDRKISIEENIRMFGYRITLYLKYMNRFPAAHTIDKENALGYAMIANEFTEAKRITTHNFHTLSESFFEQILSKECQDQGYVLELGPGQGWLRKTIKYPITNYDILELTEEMAGYNIARKKIISSASRMPISSESYDLVISSLGDPYFYPEALSEIFRVLKHSGKFAFSLPDFEWACALRGSNHKTTFVSDKGISAETYSFVFEKKDLRQYLEDCGFVVEKIESIKGSLLFESGDTISPAITIAADNVGSRVEEMSIVTICLCRKE